MSIPPPVPYRGIRPFRFADHSIFFAREEETSHLLQLVAVYRGVMLYGESGVGKSSLINAGLLPAAVRLGFQAERVRVQPRPGEEIVIRRIAVGDDESEFLPSAFVDEDDDAPVVILSCDAFAERVREIAPTRRPLLVFDQFEELVTLFEEVDELPSQWAVAEMLGALLRDQVSAKLLFVFREDYLARVKSLLVAAPELVDQALRLRPARPESLATIIRGPFERHPGHFDHELSPALSEQLQAALADRFGSGDVSLSEVETVCLRLWRSDDPEAVLAERWVQGILEDYLGEELDRLPEDLRYAAGALLSQMVTSAGTRNVISAEDLIAHVQDDEQLARPLLQEALDRLEEDSKLVRREHRRDLYLYEITSEFLLPWIGQRRAELVRTRERRRLRRRLLIFGAIAAALVIVLVLTALGLYYARGEREKAQHSAAEAAAAAEVARASRMLATHPAAALATALRAATSLRESTTGPHTQAIKVLSDAAIGSHLAGSLRVPGSPVVGVGFARRGSRLITVLADGRIDSWTVGAGRRLRLGRNGFVRAPQGVTAARFSRDGSLVALNGPRGWSLWQTEGLKALGMLPKGLLAFSPNGRLIAIGASRPTPRVDVFAAAPDGRRPIASLRFSRPGKSVMRAVDFDRRSQHLVALFKSGRWAVWNLQTPRQRAAIHGPTATAGRTYVAAMLSRDGRLLAVVTNDTVGGRPHAFIRLYEARTGHLLEERDIAASVSAVGAGRRLLVLAGLSGSVQIWKVERGAEPIVLSGHLGPVTGVVVSNTGAWIATTGADNTTRIWDAKTGDLRNTLLGHTNQIRFLALTPGARATATASDDGTVRVWRTLGSDDTALPQHLDDVGQVAFSANGGFVITAALDGTVHIVWVDGTLRKALTTGRNVFRSSCHSYFTRNGFPDWLVVDACVARTALNPSGTRLVTGQDDIGGARLWTTGEWKRTQLGSRSEYVESVLFAGRRKSWATIIGSDGISLYDARTGARLRPLTTIRTRPYPLAAAVDSRGRYVVVGNREPSPHVAVWDVPARHRVHAWPVPSFPKVVAIDPSGTTAAAGTTGLEVLIWRIRDGKRLARLKLGFSVHAIAFSPNGKTLATATSANTVDLWDAVTGTRLMTLRGHTGGVNSVEFSDDGRFIVTASDDGTVRVWGAQYGETLAVFRQGRTGRAVDAAFDRLGTRVVVGASDGSSDIFECRICVGEGALFGYATAQKAQRPIQMSR